ncbi:hypothetical protein [Xylocopilactobacillus apicola]|uniref:Uncharacterized protein n=1 Tax=Xylocopilactobacillus apicola TaxID=2932184 RepID=A0AAU9D205_9LACO|nr:hypothetical protein [Xylocopilactobacillus apicola]BDR57744.1 hypothetical protein XA3_01850 [Xylocopilactobacillus apicola]
MKQELIIKLVIKIVMWIIFAFVAVWPILSDIHMVQANPFIENNQLIFVALFLLYTTTNLYKLDF